MKLFNKATLKLTAFYTAVLLLTSIIFSVVVATTTNHEMKRPFDDRRSEVTIVTSSSPDDLVGKVFFERSEQINKRIITALILVNFGVLILGATGSYFLARWTLGPIEKAMDTQARFISDASHELRTPLAAIQMENEVTLRDKKLGKTELHAQVKSNLEEVGKLRELTERLLKLSQKEALEKTDVDIAEVISGSVGRITKIVKVKKITVKQEIQPATINTNAEALTDIVAILLDNAIKYSSAKSTITIRADKQKIAIIDEGVGIAPDDLPHIFDRFYRAEQSRTSDGFGLGLSLAKSLATQLGLKISAENNVDYGATFYIKLFS